MKGTPFESQRANRSLAELQTSGSFACDHQLASTAING
jgi:hypothetical protein